VGKGTYYHISNHSPFLYLIMVNMKHKKKNLSKPEAINEEPMPAEPELTEAAPLEAELPDQPGIEYNQPESS
jgi:hypothetical protein